MSRPISIVDAVAATTDPPLEHQLDAWRWLDENLTPEQRHQFGGRFRKAVAVPTDSRGADVAALEPLLALIRAGESGKDGYHAANRGRAGDTPGGWPGLEAMTLNQVMAAHLREELGAAGAYQFMPDTLRKTAQALGADHRAKFDKALQDQLAAELILGGKRPRLRDWIQGKAPNTTEALAAAQLDLAREWAAIPTADGWGVHDGDSAGNRATAKVAQVQAALRAARAALGGKPPSAHQPASSAAKPSRPPVAVPIPPRPPATLQREPQHYSQRDSRVAGQAPRSCFSSANAMLVKALRPAALQGPNADDDYLKVVGRYGDTTEPAAQLKALAHFGITARLEQQGTFELIEQQIRREIPVTLGFIHRGPLDALRGDGHWLFGYGIDATHLDVHDPWGEADLITGTTLNSNGRALRYSRRNFGRRWMVVPDGRGGWRYAPGKGWMVVVEAVAR